MDDGSVEAQKELVLFLARSLVDEPDDVRVEVVDDDRRTTLELTVAQEDLGKVIGKDGRTARAIRTLLSSMQSRSRRRVLLDILE
ncbi:MAG: RNA-binding protein [Sandaracinus sp.]|nr:RNA-binding protein [Sandaracinus sp.]|tara:strand:+ start:992 stop:1246 length:255 start_codon:yes stop_codon:yes gene_type:complete